MNSSIITAKEILGNPDYLAISYGGFREKTRDLPPSVEELKEDMRILSALKIKLIRTYNTQLFPHASRVLQAIQELKEEDSSFEMYVMLGAWIECEGAFTENRNHNKENLDQNRAEIETAIKMANKYPDIVKIIAVGNEAMVHWAETYFVHPSVILKYVSALQSMKKSGELDPNIWITSSDNFASWGGGSADYHNEDLDSLLKAVDYISMHTYPFHDTHYNSEFWLEVPGDSLLNRLEKIDKAMLRAKEYAMSQFQATKRYMNALGIDKEIHIGETGWATSSHSHYGTEGSKAADEYKQKLFYDHMRDWSKDSSLSCFFFEAFDEPWKDPNDERGSENHFGLIDINSQAKFVLWKSVEKNAFDGITRNGKAITKTFNGNIEELVSAIEAPPVTYNPEKFN